MYSGGIREIFNPGFGSHYLAAMGEIYGDGCMVGWDWCMVGWLEWRRWMDMAATNGKKVFRAFLCSSLT